VPIGLFATVWGYLKLRELGQRRPARIDWPGNVSFAIGLVLVMTGISYGIEPYGADSMGWTNPAVIGELGLGVGLLVAFCIIETKVEQPMLRMQLFKIRAFTAGVFASLLAALSRGGLTADRLPVLCLRYPYLLYGAHDGFVRVPEPRRGDEQPSC
jgi:hypothetical protein